MWLTMAEQYGDSGTTEQDRREQDRRELAETLAALRAMQRGGGNTDALGEAAKKLPGKGELIKVAPGIAMICGTIIVLAIVVVFGVLTVVGKPTDELFRLMNLFLNAMGAIGVLATLIVAITHARRTMDARKEVLTNRQATLAVGAEVHTAAEAAGRAAKSSGEAARAVNGELVKRVIDGLRPVVQSAAAEAARTAYQSAYQAGFRKGSEAEAGPDMPDAPEGAERRP
jgi:hypothetical protein